MKTENKSRMSLRLLAVVWALATISMCFVPSDARALTVQATDDPFSIGDGQIVKSVELLSVFGTANILSGAEIAWMDAMPGCTINIYGGQVSVVTQVWAGYYDYSLEEYIPDAAITVYGTNFAVDGDPCETSATEFTLPWDYSNHILTGNYGDGTYFSLTFWGYRPVKIYLAPPEGDGGEVDIDIKPGSDTNVINLKSKGVIPVAILTTGNFDAGTVDPESVEFAGASPVRWTLEDVDDDGDKDLLLHFETQKLNFAAEKSDADASSVKKVKLTGKTEEGSPVSGSDNVKIISSKK